MKAGLHSKQGKKVLCSFFAKGACNKGDKCAFSHEITEDDIKSILESGVLPKDFDVNMAKGLLKQANVKAPLNALK